MYENIGPSSRIDFRKRTFGRVNIAIDMKLPVRLSRVRERDVINLLIKKNV